ncbi:amylo-alpha-1,6-glucosidase [Deinococcus yavapaiensis]|uniref:beta-fructofuranosidase n=1 Tax=Deinococcus yavapaiensis KR-236 TaxID=694435 RepID=A0A318S6S5_9DEIO|nr:glycoside hydrolase 100 family protein [Deinococcus yavapaiensis]PYE54593.1 alkaline and neutral invertase-like protein [Deinococcus yavapaiensis KR-236]
MTILDSSAADAARPVAEATVLANGSAIGLLGASSAYKQVWARDSMICTLGLLQCADPEGAQIARRSVRTLATYQSRLGNVPHNVGFSGIPDPALIAHGGSLQAGDADVVVDTAHAGCIDNSLWFILGNWALFDTDGDVERLRTFWPNIQKAYTWLEYQDSNECGLLEVHEAMDWADLFANRYNSLWPNVLWFAVHKAMARISRALGEDGASFDARADDVKFKVDTLLWLGPEVEKDMGWVERNRKEWLYPIRLTTTVLQERPFFLPYMAFRDYADRFDTFGNLIAILFGLASPAQANKILDFIESAGVNHPWPVKAIHPPVMPGEADWREYYRLRNLNLPNQYHNGGIWPFIGGFYVAALVKAGRLQEAATQLERLALANKQSRTPGLEWDFNEWLHGTSGRPSGFRGQSWSAAMYVYAHECVKRGEVPVWGNW